MAAAGNGYVISPVPNNLLCYDIANSAGSPVAGGSGEVDIGDFNYFLGVLMSYANGPDGIPDTADDYSGPCLP